MFKIEKKDEILNEKLLWEMANIDPDETGLPSVIQSLAKGQSRVSHAARVKVYTPNFKWVPIQIDPEVKLPKSMEHKNFQKEDLDCLKPALKYIEKNRDVFLAHWKDQIADYQLHKILAGELSLKQAIEDRMKSKKKNGEL